MSNTQLLEAGYGVLSRKFYGRTSRAAENM